MNRRALMSAALVALVAIARCNVPDVPPLPGDGGDATTMDVVPMADATSDVADAGSPTDSGEAGDAPNHAFDASACALAAYWTMDETTGARKDSSGHGLDLIIDTPIVDAGLDSSIGSTSGKFGNAAVFSSARGNILLVPASKVTSSPIDITSPPVTVAGWIYADDLAGNAVGTKAFGIVRECVGALYHVHLGSNAAIYGSVSNSGATSAASAAGVITLNAWHHYALTYDGATLVVFLDGVATASASFNLTNLNGGNLSNVPFVVGGWQDDYPCNGGAAEILYGLVDDVAVFNTALDATNIGAIMTLGVAGYCASL